mmetsp:Transcript_7392/g.24373  ORF Transcript_7392/g.24373 Transcript_7392/m.24373 type:complete len:205 (+) Transcript_7392:1082-1696(+)
MFTKFFSNTSGYSRRERGGAPTAAARRRSRPRSRTTFGVWVMRGKVISGGTGLILSQKDAVRQRRCPPPAQGRGRGVGRRARGEAYHARRVDSVQLPGALSSSTRPAVSVRSTLRARPAARSKTASAAPHAWRPSRKALSTASTKSGRSTKKSTSCAMLWSVKMSTSVAIIPRSPGILKMVCLSSRTAFGSLGRVVDGDARATS